MLCDDLSVKINEYFGICAHHPLILLGGVQLAAVNTPTEERAPLILPVTLSATQICN